MAGDSGPPRGHLSLSTDRMVALSDGVFGFAMTLLVLDIAVRPPGTPLEQLLHAWPAYVAYLVSFLTIGGTWLLHTVLTERLARADPIFVRLNLLALLVVVFLIRAWRGLSSPWPVWAHCSARRLWDPTI